MRAVVRFALTAASLAWVAPAAIAQISIPDAVGNAVANATSRYQPDPHCIAGEASFSEEEIASVRAAVIETMQE